MKVSGGELCTSINSSTLEKKAPKITSELLKLKYEKYQIDILNYKKRQSYPNPNLISFEKSLK